MEFGHTILEVSQAKGLKLNRFDTLIPYGLGQNEASGRWQAYEGGFGSQNVRFSKGEVRRAIPSSKIPLASSTLIG